MSKDEKMQTCYKITSELATLVSHATQVAVMSGGDRSGPKSLHIALGAISAVMDCATLILARKDGRGPDISEAYKCLTPDATLFTALVAVRAVTHKGDGGAELCTGISTIYEAMEDFEKLTGRKPDSFLSQNLVKAARETANESVVALENFLKNRSLNGNPPSATQH